MLAWGFRLARPISPRSSTRVRVGSLRNRTRTAELATRVADDVLARSTGASFAIVSILQM